MPPNPLKFRIVALRIAWVCYLMILFVATHIPVPDSFDVFVSLFDKVIHASAFFVLSMLTLLALYWKSTLRAPPYWMLGGLLAYAALDEYLQGFVGRTPDLRDWQSDAFGILLAFLILRFIASQNHSIPVSQNKASSHPSPVSSSQPEISNQNA